MTEKEWSPSRTYTPKPGFEWNPLKRYRNLPCLCGSKKKVKLCHGAQEIVSSSDAKLMRQYLRNLSAAGFIEARPSDIAAA